MGDTVFRSRPIERTLPTREPVRASHPQEPDFTWSGRNDRFTSHPVRQLPSEPGSRSTGGRFGSGGYVEHPIHQNPPEPISKPSNGRIGNGGYGEHPIHQNPSEPASKPTSARFGSGGYTAQPIRQNPVEGNRGGHVTGQPIREEPHGGGVTTYGGALLTIGGNPHGIDGRGHQPHDPIHRPPTRIVDFPWRGGDGGRHDWGGDWNRDWDHGHRDHDGLYIIFGGDYYRTGFVYCDDYYRHPQWCYPAYYYEPSSVCVASPFYYYPELPPYLSVSCVTYGGYYAPFGASYTSYTYVYPGQCSFQRQWSDNPYTSSGRSYSYDENRYSDRTKFDRALDDVVDGFGAGDFHYVENLIPDSGSVAISQDGIVRYSLGAQDFGNMYRDLVQTTRSRGYEITDVRVFPDDSARVLARHTRIDAFGNRTSVYHEYLMAYENHRFVIRRFGVNYNAF